MQENIVLVPQVSLLKRLPTMKSFENDVCVDHNSKKKPVVIQTPPMKVIEYSEVGICKLQWLKGGLIEFLEAATEAFCQGPLPSARNFDMDHIYTLNDQCEVFSETEHTNCRPLHGKCIRCLIGLSVHEHDSRKELRLKLHAAQMRKMDQPPTSAKLVHHDFDDVNIETPIIDGEDDECKSVIEPVPMTPVPAEITPPPTPVPSEAGSSTPASPSAKSSSEDN